MGIKPGVVAGIWSLAVHDCPVLIFSSYLLEVLGMIVSSLAEPQHNRPIKGRSPGLGFNRLINLGLWAHLKHCPRVSLLELVKLIRVAPGVRQDSQMFITHIVPRNTYRVMFISCIIGQSVKISHTTQERYRNSRFIFHTFWVQ